MNTVTFPAFNLTINIENIAFNIGGVAIYWYAIFITSAIGIAALIFKKRDGLYGIKFNEIMDLAVLIIPISIISARFYYIIFYDVKYYFENPIQMLNIRNGGLAIYGGIIGGIITCVIFCKKRKIDLLNLLDFMAPALALGQAIGRWGNFVNIEAYGTETKLPWRMGIYELGEYKEVHPTFLYESIATFILFSILIMMKDKRKFKGQITYIYLIGYSFARMLIEGLRADSLMLGEIRISQLLSAIILITASVLYMNKTSFNKGGPSQLR